MLESDEDITFALSFAGEDLNFSGVIVQGIPGQATYNIPSFDSPYDIEKQEFSFQLPSKDFFALAIKKDSLFTYTLGLKIYTFKVLSYLDDLIGWTELKVELQEVS